VTPPPARTPAPPPRPGRRLRVAGLVVLGIALAVGLVCGTRVVMVLSSSTTAALTSPVRRAPLDVQLAMQAGEYTVFQRTGASGGAGPVTVTVTSVDAPTLTADDVHAAGPDGRLVEVRPLPGNVHESLARGSLIFTGVAHLRIPAAGTYRVTIAADPAAQVVITPSFEFGPVIGWIGGGVLSVLAAAGGLVLFLVGLRRGRRTVAPLPAAPPPGWYPDPWAPDRTRHWDGRTWGPDSR